MKRFYKSIFINWGNILAGRHFTLPANITIVKSWYAHSINQVGCVIIHPCIKSAFLRRIIEYYPENRLPFRRLNIHTFDRKATLERNRLLNEITGTQCLGLHLQSV